MHGTMPMGRTQGTFNEQMNEWVGLFIVMLLKLLPVDGQLLEPYCVNIINLM